MACVLTLSLAVAFLCNIGVRADDAPWYQEGVVYQLYPRSFQDSDGDGIGDLKGILQHVDYLASLGIDAVWLNPIYPSPNIDFGYDISNFTAVSPEYGTMEDFDNLVKALKKYGIRVVMDYVPNHSSDKHDWFVRSCAGETKYQNYYVWLKPTRKPDGTIVPPNNWTGTFGGSMWKYHEGRKEMYLHQYAEGQPDLNYRNPDVVKEMEDVLTFWLKRGVAGFRMDTVSTLVEDDSWADEPYHPGCGDPNSSNCYDHTKTTEQPLTYVTLRNFKETLEKYAKNTDNVPRIMMTESWSNDPKILSRYYGTQNAPTTTFPFNFLCIMRMTVDEENPAKQWAETINTWYNQVQPGSWAQPNLVLGNHDKHRFASRFTPEYSDIMNMVLLTVKGTALVYYGDELGLVNSIVRRDQGRDLQGLRAAPGKFYESSRDPGRNPMPWNNTVNGGFSTGTPWLPLASDYPLNNVASQQSSPTSHLKVFQTLTKLRKTRTLRTGTCEVTHSDGALIVLRVLADNPSVITVVNMDNGERVINLAGLRESVPAKLNVVVKSVNYLNNATAVDTSAITLPPLTGLVLSTKTAANLIK